MSDMMAIGPDPFSYALILPYRLVSAVAVC